MLLEESHWWKTGAVSNSFALPYKRKVFAQVLEYLPERQIQAIIGLRRTGKSTLLYQLIAHLIEKKVPPKNIIYHSFDEGGGEFGDVIKTYEEQVIKRGVGVEKTFLFLDEIQKLENWPEILKRFYDLHPAAKIVVSGSASLNILLPAKESLAGRIYYHSLGPLEFTEFLELRGKGKEIAEPGLWKKELRIELSNYLIRAFPEVVNASDETARKYVKEGVLDQAIFRDLARLFRIKEVELIEKICGILASNPGALLNVETLAKELGRSRQTISNYLYYLEACFIAASFSNYRGSKRVSSRKLKKHYLANPALALALASPPAGPVIENLVASTGKAKNYWREGNNEVDFVTPGGKPIVVKYSAKAASRDYRGLLAFMKKFKAKKALVLTDDQDETKTISGKKIEFKPIWQWLLQNP